MLKQVHLNRFLALSYLYFLMTEKPSEDVASIEIEEWLEIINLDEQASTLWSESVPGATALAHVEALLPRRIDSNRSNGQ